MDCLKTCLVELTKLVKKKNKNGILTSGEYAQVLGVSQQSASRYLKQLEQAGYITRNIKENKQEISFSKKGIASLQEYNNLIGKFLTEENPRIKGIVTSGLGEGSYYIQKYSNRIKKSVGFKPFPGTLNLAFDGSPYLPDVPSFHIPGFESNERAYGSLDLYNARIDFDGTVINCFLIIPERTHKRNQLEFICEVGLRNKLNLKDGDIALAEIL